MTRQSSGLVDFSTIEPKDAGFNPSPLLVHESNDFGRTGETKVVQGQPRHEPVAGGPDHRPDDFVGQALVGRWAQWERSDAAERDGRNEVHRPGPTQHRFDRGQIMVDGARCVAGLKHRLFQVFEFARANASGGNVGERCDESGQVFRVVAADVAPPFGVFRIQETLGDIDDPSPRPTSSRASFKGGPFFDRFKVSGLGDLFVGAEVVEPPTPFAAPLARRMAVELRRFWHGVGHDDRSNGSSQLGSSGIVLSAGSLVSA